MLLYFRTEALVKERKEKSGSSGEAVLYQPLVFFHLKVCPHHRVKKSFLKL